MNWILGGGGEGRLLYSFPSPGEPNSCDLSIISAKL